MEKQAKGGRAKLGALSRPTLPKKSASIGHVLVVEDDAILAMTLEQTLEDAGAAAVTVCAAADEALAFLRENKPKVVVLDVHLADSDEGYEIAQLLSAIGPNPPKIIFSTGNPQDIPEDIASMGPVLEKPYDPARLIELAQEPPRRGLLGLFRRPRTKA